MRTYQYLDVTAAGEMETRLARVLAEQVGSLSLNDWHHAVPDAACETGHADPAMPTYRYESQVVPHVDITSEPLPRTTGPKSTMYITAVVSATAEAALQP